MLRSHRVARRSVRKSRAGFTLIELLFVLAILVVLGAMAVSTFTNTQKGADINAARGQIGIFDTQVDLYHFHTKQYPSKLEDLVEKPSASNVADRWEGPYIKGTSLPVDPWGNPYKIQAPGKKNPEGADLWSMGPDGQDGTDDDIGNWKGK